MLEGLIEGCGGCCFTVVFVLLLCCVLVVGAVVYVYMSAPEPPLGDNFRAKQEEANQFQYIIDTFPSPNAPTFRLQFNERQISSWMALEGARYAEENGRRFPFENIQVGLADGEMTFYAEIERYGLKLPLEVIIVPTRVTPSYTPGQLSRDELKFEVREAHLGGIRVPKFVLDPIQDQFHDLLVQPLDQVGGAYNLGELTVGDDPYTAQEDNIFRITGSVVVQP
jgi:hypothetical protein